MDICGWHPTKDILLTAGTDKKVFLWDLEGVRAKDKRVPKPMELELDITDSVTCYDWSQDGRMLALGELKWSRHIQVK